MKKIITILVCVMPAFALAQKANPVADTLEYLYSIANSKFDALQPTHTADYETLPLHILAADEVFLVNNGVFGYDLVLKYHHVNPRAAATLKEIQSFMKHKEGSKDWAFQRFKDPDPATLMYKQVPVFHYSVYDPGYETYFTIRISQTTPVVPPLADETAYDGKLPAFYDKGGAPQVMQTTGKGPAADSYIRYNGVFGPLGFMSGRMTLHGYGEFYEGDFISQNFHPADKGRVNAIFIPANTHDTIYGQLLDSSMREFAADLRYTGYVKNKYYSILPDAPHWVSVSENHHMELYAQDKKEREELAAKNYVPGNRTYNNNTEPAKPYVKSPCSCCNGRGTKIVYTTTEYQKKDQFGVNQGIGTHYVNVSCSCCGGSGWR